MAVHERSTAWCEGRVVADQQTNFQDWLAARERYVCASEIGRAMSVPWSSGKNPTPGPERYASLVERKLYGTEPEQNEQMWWGNELEPHVIAALPKCPQSETYGWNIRPCQLLIEDARCKRLAATTDMWVDDGHGPMCGDLKISAFAWAPSKAKPRPVDYVPLDYQLQVQAQMACTGAQRGCLVQFVGNRVANVIIMQRDPRVIAQIREAAEMFWLELEAA